MRALSSRSSKSGKTSGNSSVSGAEPRPPRDVSGVRYDVLDRVGEGTLWVVYRVRERSNNRLLALKALKNNFNAHPQFAPALALSLAASADFSHPLLARVEEVGREDGTLFCLQEWMAGQSLEARLRRAPFGRIETVTSLRQIAEALQYLHEKRAVHGDLRPRQILSSGDGELKLCDFGLSNSFAAAGLSSADVLQDAVGYTAPELGAAAGKQAAPATAASDMYALGVILYRMLAGRAPFEGASPVAVAMRHRNDAPLPPSRFNPHCPPDLEEIALQLLQKNPRMRPTATALLQTLGTSAISTPVSTEELDPNRTQPLPTNLNPDDLDGSSTRLASADANDDINTSDAANASNALFPATMPISAIANAPLPNAATIAAAATSSATASSATSSAATSSAATASATTSVATPLAGTTSVSLPPQLPPTAQDLAADAALEKKARKKHRRREALGAFLAFLWIWVAVGALAGMVYKSYYWWIEQTPHDIKVPSYLGKNEVQAEAIFKKAGLQFRLAGEVYDLKRPAGTVIRGYPPAGKVVKPGRPIDVTVSRGAEKVVMPDLSELDLIHVREILRKAGMRLGNISTMYHDTIARGYICGQYPQPGDAFSRSEPINLVISRGTQPGDVTNAAQLPAPPTPDTTTTQEPANPPIGAPETLGDNLTTNPNPSDTTSGELPPDGSAPMVSRTVLVRIPVPAKAGVTSRQVRVVVSDAGGQNTVYEQDHAPGELIDEYVQVTRAQGGSATISIYIDGKLQKQQRV